MTVFSSFLTVGEQVLILFILMAIGFVLGKTGLIGEAGSKNMSSLVMYAVTPCMMISAFQRELISSDFHGFLTLLLMSLGIHAAVILLATLLVRDKDISRQRTLRFATVFSNCGFMGYPLMTAILGPIGVFYGSAYVTVFHLLTWTWGVFNMTGDRSRLKLRPILLNPGVLSVVIALSLYLLQITVPELLMKPINYMAALNTPIPMIVVGYQLSRANFSAALKGVSSWVTLLLRLVVIPLLALGLCLTLGLPKDITTVIVICCATPPAALLSMFAAKFETDTALASSVVSVQTALSVLTMPLIVGLAQYLA